MDPTLQSKKPRNWIPNPTGIGGWKPGVSGNPTGKSKSAQDLFIKMQEYRQQSKELGFENPVLFQHRIMADASQPVGLRVSCANNISGYYEPKYGTKAVPRYIENPVDILPATSIEEATINLARISTYMARGELDVDIGNHLIAANKAIIDALQATEVEARLRALEQLRGISPPTATIGGLPPLPGTNIDIPGPTIIDGHADDLNGKSPIVPPAEDDGTSLPRAGKPASGGIVAPHTDNPDVQEPEPE
jgi:hypothetical protein